MPGRKASEEVRREEILRAAYDVAARHGIGALTVRAVAKRANVSHGTVLFHFRRRSELVGTLLDRVLYATATLRIPDEVGRLTRPVEKLQGLLRTEMARLSEEARHFRLFLEYYALGVRDPAIRRRISAALEQYRVGFRSLVAPVLEAQSESRARRGVNGRGVDKPTPDGIAAVAVSLVHGCALQAVIDAKRFDVERHCHVGARMLEERV